MIELNHISKEFHGVPALKQVTASIEKGHVFGLIGSNGARKEYPASDPMWHFKP